ncbi:reverse transcriptase [Gossypium australe]|uniref:Reverse transcriptase n=1 Tax=Gossypium australe TaxID=47621 RepID=A0A5B6V8Z5_9ROSI|nr:reverse transcriptase [Gossypium australe]
MNIVIGLVDETGITNTMLEAMPGVAKQYFVDLFSSSDQSDFSYLLGKYWHIVGPDIIEFCLGVLQGDVSLFKINSTNIVIILKVVNPRYMSQFRPIGLCNMVYKIISNVLVNHFKQVWNVCIDESQSAFRQLGKTGSFMLKIDMSKAYNWVEWNFLKVVMLRMGFTLTGFP